MHTRKERQKNRKRLRRNIGYIILSLSAIFLLVGAWKLTTFAVHKVISALDKQQNSVIEFPIHTSAEVIENEPTDDVTEEFISKDILLINKDHPLEDTYRPSLVSLDKYGVQVDSSIYDDLCEMLKAGEQEGLRFWIASAYRSPERQRELLDEDIEELIGRGYSYSEAYEEAVRETMPVGCSEHATGLAVDIVAKDYQMLDEKQGRTPEINWLQKNCSQYGFILRYPEGKEDITKVDYESWHFRYVGVGAAKEIMEQNLTLEEYMNPDMYD